MGPGLDRSDAFSVFHGFWFPSDGRIMRVARPHIRHSNYIIFRVYFEGIKSAANGQILYCGDMMEYTKGGTFAAHYFMKD